VKVFVWPIGDGSKLLTLWALSHMLLGVIEHLGAIVSLVNGFIGERLPSGMIATVTVMNLLPYPPGLLGSEASQVWVRV